MAPGEVPAVAQPTPHPRRSRSTSQDQTVKVSGLRCKAALVNGFGGFVFQRLMGAHGIILLNVYADCLAQSPGVGIFIEVDSLCFEAAEPPFNHHVVRPPGLSVHTLPDAKLPQQRFVGVAGKLTALIGV